MTDNEYLKAILLEHSLAGGSTGLTELREHGEEVKAFLRNRFPGATVNEAGSKKKGTMIADSYDLDLTCYFRHDDCTAGDCLQEIYESVASALSEKYHVTRKRSALRLSGLSGKTDLHIDVVPGRFVEGSTGDVFLHQTSGDKERLKTNLDKHVQYVRNSGVRDAIKLMKLWRHLNGIDIKTFVLELLVIELLDGKTTNGLSDQMILLWQQLEERAGTISVEDPANPSGNDLSQLFDADLRKRLLTSASDTVKAVANEGLETVFGSVRTSNSARIEGLRHAAAATSTGSRPWAND